MTSTKILFIGNYFSHSRGTKPVMERVAVALNGEGIHVSLSSGKSFWGWRAVDHFRNIFFRSYSIAFVDVFSDRSFLLAEWAAFWLVLRKKDIVLTLRGGKLAEFEAKNNRRVYQLFKQAKRIQTPSLFLQEYFRNKDFEIYYLPNPVDINLFSFFQKTDTSTAKKLLWVRAFSDIYNPHLAILILQKVLLQFPDTILTMIGPDKGLMNKTLALAEKLNLADRVDVIGSVPNEELYKYFHSHDVYLNTTSYESFGVAIVEAASCGIPVVSFSVGEIPYLWTNNENILLAEFGDVEKMADQVRRLFLDRDLSNHISMVARKKAEEFSWENVKKQWFNIVEN